MQKHYILTLDPMAKYEWDRCTLRDPITASRPELAQLIADAVGEVAGSYLVSVQVEVQILEKTDLPQGDRPTLVMPELSQRPQSARLQKVAG